MMNETDDSHELIQELTEKAAIGISPDDFRDIVVIIPCLNEELTIAKVVSDFRNNLPGVRILVFDNNSTDRTAEIALAEGAEVIHSYRAGKGNVVRHAFDTIDAGIYILVDGDDTYDASAARQLTTMIRDGEADMVVVGRMKNFDKRRSFRRFHQFGNILITGLVSSLFGIRLTDVLSGYRAVSSDFAKYAPLESEGFEIETEMTLQAIDKKYTIREIMAPYGKRPEGSSSKLSTLGDGFLIIKLIIMILRNYKPLFFFGTLGVSALIGSIFAGIPPILDYYHDKFVSHVPLAILAAGLGILSVLFIGIGLILHSFNVYHRENYNMFRKLARGLDKKSD